MEKKVIQKSIHNNIVRYTMQTILFFHDPTLSNG